MPKARPALDLGGPSALPGWWAKLGAPPNAKPDGDGLCGLPNDREGWVSAGLPNEKPEPLPNEKAGLS